MFLATLIAVVYFPLNEHQADVLMFLCGVAFGGNVAEHYKEALREAFVGRNSRPGGPDLPGPR